MGRPSESPNAQDSQDEALLRIPGSQSSGSQSSQDIVGYTPHWESYDTEKPFKGEKWLAGKLKGEVVGNMCVVILNNPHQMKDKDKQVLKEVKVTSYVYNKLKKGFRKGEDVVVIINENMPSVDAKHMMTRAEADQRLKDRKGKARKEKAEKEKALAASSQGAQLQTQGESSKP